VVYGAGLPWDHAPGSLLLSEAGAFLGGTDGAAYAPAGPRAPGLVAAADHATYDAVLARL
jgi:fructose-1,6-bisphosphatase/inositol monophosphatase family enzyme